MNGWTFSQNSHREKATISTTTIWRWVQMSAKKDKWTSRLSASECWTTRTCPQQGHSTLSGWKKTCCPTQPTCSFATNNLVVGEGGWEGSRTATAVAESQDYACWILSLLLHKLKNLSTVSKHSSVLCSGLTYDQVNVGQKQERNGEKKCSFFSWLVTYGMGQSHQIVLPLLCRH